MARTVVSSRAQGDQFAPTAWSAQPADGPRTRELELPSGQNCLIRRATVDELIAEHVLANPRFQRGMRVEVLESGDIEAEHVRNRLLCALVLKPPLTYPPNGPRARDVIYADAISAKDRAAILRASGLVT